MVNVLIHHKVKDFHVWKEVFDAAFTFRKQAGETSFRLYHAVDDPNDVTLWFEWESSESAEKFLKSDELARQMKRAGVEGQPEFQVLRELLAMRRTSAD